MQSSSSARSADSYSSLSRGLGVLACAAAIAGVGASTKAATVVVYVDQSAPAGGNGSSWNHAFNDLQGAIDAVRSGTFGNQLSALEFRIAQGTYKPDRATGDRGAFFDVDIGAVSSYSLTMQGSFAGLAGPNPDAQDFVRTRTILSGDLAGNDSSDLSTRAENSHLILRLAKRFNFSRYRGVSVQGAFTAPGEIWSGRSGGVRVENGDSSFTEVYFENATFEDNHALGDGGAIWSSWGATRFLDCRFRRNVSLTGRGGAFAQESPNFGRFSEFQRCVLEDNRAIRGGAVFSTGRVDLANVAIADNEATESGGAVAANRLVTLGSLFFRNRAPEGAAISVASSLDIHHCTFAGHSLTEGAVIDGQGELTIDRTLLWNNQTASSRKLIRYSTVGSWSKVSDCFIEGGTSLIEIPTGTLQFQNVLGTDPHFVDPWPGSGSEDWRTWNYRLRPDSSAIKKGQNLYPYDIEDLDGYPMKGSGSTKTADLGCYYADTRICFANFTGRDYLVDDTDFLIFARAYGHGAAPNADMRADLNRDGIVNDADFTLFSAAYDQLLCP